MRVIFWKVLFLGGNILEGSSLRRVIFWKTLFCVGNILEGFLLRVIFFGRPFGYCLYLWKTLWVLLIFFRIILGIAYMALVDDLLGRRVFLIFL